MDRMASVWSQKDYVKCIHPGWNLLIGWESVAESWQTIFRNTEEIRFSTNDIVTDTRDRLAWVVLTENISMRVRGQIHLSCVLATNIFELDGTNWLMIHHHASSSAKLNQGSAFLSKEKADELLR